MCKSHHHVEWIWKRCQSFLYTPMFYSSRDQLLPRRYVFSKFPALWWSFLDFLNTQMQNICTLALYHLFIILPRNLISYPLQKMTNSNIFRIFYERTDHRFSWKIGHSRSTTFCPLIQLTNSGNFRNGFFEDCYRKLQYCFYFFLISRQETTSWLYWSTWQSFLRNNDFIYFYKIILQTNLMETKKHLNQ